MTETGLEDLAPALARLYLHEDLDRFKQESQFVLSDLVPEDDDREVIADSMATALYYSLPLPGRGFKSETPPTPGRNDPCDCGSGKKYKKCCGRKGKPKPPDLPFEALFQIVMSGFGPEHWGKLAEDPELPPGLREAMMEFCLRTGQAAMADAIAQPLFNRLGSLSRRDVRSFSLAMDALAEILPPARRHRRLEELLKAVKTAPIRSILHQRLAMRSMDGGDATEAREHLRKAQQADPEQEELPLSELSVLAYIGSEEELVTRARFWHSRLWKQYGPNHPYYDFIEDVIERGKGATADWMAPEVLEAGKNDAVQDRVDRLCNVLTQTEAAFEDEMTRRNFRECVVKTPKKLAKPVRRLLKDVYHLEDSGAGSRLILADLLEPLPAGPEAWVDPDSDWLDALESRPDLLGNATVLLAVYELAHLCPDDSGHAMTTIMPPLLQHIGRYLGVLLGSLKGEGYLSHGTVNGHAISLLARSHMIDLRFLNEMDMAIKVGEHYLEINPGDPSAVRFVLASLYAEQGKSEAASTLKDQYRNGQNPELTASLMQAYAFDGDYGNALKQLNHLVNGYPSAFRELTEFITGLAEADPWATNQPFHGMDVYWSLNQHLWHARPEALAWLKRNLP